MTTTTKDKLEFALLMGRHTRATLRQVQALMRYAGTLQRLSCGIGHAQLADNRKRERIQRKVVELCGEIDTGDAWHNGLREYWHKHECHPVFTGAVLKIRVPDGYTNDMGREGICVPS